jgi:RHS repeat-associated protein
VKSGATTTYVYDAGGRRVRKSVVGVTTDYVYNLGGTVTEVNSAGVWSRTEIYAGGKHLATYAGGVSGTTYFNHTDWLGTERVRSDMTGAACETVTSLIFGDGQSVSGGCGDPSTRHFTGKQRDDESGLDDFGARYYSSQLGRFVSADWSAVPDKVDDQAVAELVSLLNTSTEIPVREWVVITLRDLGPSAKSAIPDLQKILAAEDCAKEPSMAISVEDNARSALRRMGVTHPPSPCGRPYMN